MTAPSSVASRPAPAELRDLADQFRQAAERALGEDALREVAERVARFGESATLELPAGDDVRTRLPAAVAALKALKQRLADDGAPADPTADGAPDGKTGDTYALERIVLLRAAVAAAGRVPTLPVDDGVRRLFFDEFRIFAAPSARQRPLLKLGTATFRAACELARLVRFPAGQYHWDVSGLSRRMLLKVPPLELPRVLYFLARRMRGVAPAFFPHVNGFRRNPFVWVEAESNRSFHRMARALALQPQMLGLVTHAWLHDPDLHVVSPHLAWINRVFLDNGGLVVANGSAARDKAVLANNAARKQAVEDGQYRPRYGLVLWPRAAMLDWAARHPEFAD